MWNTRYAGPADQYAVPLNNNNRISRDTPCTSHPHPNTVDISVNAMAVRLHATCERIVGYNPTADLWLPHGQT